MDVFKIRYKGPVASKRNAGQWLRSLLVMGSSRSCRGFGKGFEINGVGGDAARQEVLHQRGFEVAEFGDVGGI